MIIKELKLDLNYISNNGDNRELVMLGDSGAIFSIEVRWTKNNGVIRYYDFSNDTWSASYKMLKNRRIDNGRYSTKVRFEAGGLSAGDNPHTYNVKLFAANELGTTHARYREARFEDGSIDINNCSGSNSALLERVLYQYPPFSLYLSGIAPNATGVFAGASFAFQNLNLDRGKSTGSLPFSITCTLGSTKAGYIVRQPVVDDLLGNVTLGLGEPLHVDGLTTPQDEESIAGTITDNPRSDSNTFTLSSVSGWAVGQTVSGVAIDGIQDLDGPVIVTNVNVGTRVVTVNKNLTIAAVTANNTIAAKDIRYRRWTTKSGTSMHNLMIGMEAFGSNLVSGSKIANYSDVTQYTRQVTASDGSISEETFNVTNVSVPAFDTLGQKPTITRGLVSLQPGAVMLSEKQVVSTARDTNHKVYAYGIQGIKHMYGMDITISDLKVELAEVSTTISDASADGDTALSDFDVASVSGILDDVSTVHGVNLNPGVATPTVTTISSSNLTLTPGSHYVQNGQTLTFKGAGRVFTISGNVTFNNVEMATTTPLATTLPLFFNVERFIDGS